MTTWADEYTFELTGPTGLHGGDMRDEAAGPDGSGLSDGLGAAADARCCWHCDDGDGNCVFPYYCTAPHTHDLSAGWDPNFREDPESPGAGVYMRCPHCNRGEPEAPNPRPCA